MDEELLRSVTQGALWADPNLPERYVVPIIVLSSNRFLPLRNANGVAGVLKLLLAVPLVRRQSLPNYRGLIVQGREGQTKLELIAIPEIIMSIDYHKPLERYEDESVKRYARLFPVYPRVLIPPLSPDAISQVVSSLFESIEGD